MKGKQTQLMEAQKGSNIGHREFCQNIQRKAYIVAAQFIAPELMAEADWRNALRRHNCSYISLREYSAGAKKTRTVRSSLML